MYTEEYGRISISILIKRLNELVNRIPTIVYYTHSKVLVEVFDILI